MPEGIWTYVLAVIWLVLITQTGMIVVMARYLRHQYTLTAQNNADLDTIGPRIAVPLPRVEAMGLDGNRVSLGGMMGRRRLLIFLSPGCTVCTAILRELPSVDVPSGTEVVLGFDGKRERVQDIVSHHAVSFPTLLDEKRAIQKRLEITLIPFALVVDEEGYVVEKGIPRGAREIQLLLAGSGRPSSTLQLWPR
jgi:hypothetical protein